MELDDCIPEPSVMPVDRAAWRNEIHRSNFVNAYCQFRDIRSCGPVSDVLVIGPGQGLDTTVLRWLGYKVVTFDIDETFEPDVIGSVHDLSMFADAQFDVVTASHVLEHMAVAYLDVALEELARVARHAIVYLPVHGRQAQIRFMPGFKGIDVSFVLDLGNWFHKPDGVTPRYAGGQHFWEVGMRGFRVSQIAARLRSHFTIDASYRNRDWPVSYNFVLTSKRWSRR